ncbi:hypothetical protein M231_01299 [Tremella mesenterica]|uniref:NADP-dependent oxidoreductase domain-containing protein n=1 Tax=Tremella mesenterica TaxID=5217 RepID=A0A4Q1BTJ1_TREME|nr:hypothetical protein M231_01299 [Tremella mesenterica]
MSILTKKFNDGNEIPIVGYGIGTANSRQECSAQIVSALNTGYRYIDTAEMYKNCPSVKDALAEWGGKREDVFILTKWGLADLSGNNDPRETLLKLLEQMGLDYVDLYLIHTPLVINGRTQSECWKMMEDLKKEGLALSIGVSNYREEDFLAFETTWEIPPAVNQLEYHPYNAHPANMIRMKTICDKHEILIMAYGSLAPLTRATGPPLENVIEGMAKETGMTTGQVLLKWSEQYSGGISVTTSTKVQRQKEQLEAFTIWPPLSDDQVDRIAQVGKERYFRHFGKSIWDKAAP